MEFARAKQKTEVNSKRVKTTNNPSVERYLT